MAHRPSISVPAAGIASAAASARVAVHGSASTPPRSLVAWLRRAASVVRTVIGAPDYDAYLWHVRSRHPGCEPLGRDEFVRQRMDSRYSKPGNRCC